MLEVAQRERDRQWNSETRQMQLADEMAENTGHQYQEIRMVEHLRGQLAMLKGSEMNIVAGMGDRDLEFKTEIQGHKLEMNEKEMRAKQLQHEAGAEAMKTTEDAAKGIQKQSKEEQQQLKEANFALAEANKILRRENLLKASATDSRERMILEEKFRELEENQRIAEKKLLEVRSENAKMKAEMCYSYSKGDSRDGRGSLTSRSDEEVHSRLRDDVKYQENEVNRLRRERNAMYDWYVEASKSYEEESAGTWVRKCRTQTQVIRNCAGIFLLTDFHDQSFKERRIQSECATMA